MCVSTCLSLGISESASGSTGTNASVGLPGSVLQLEMGSRPIPSPARQQERIRWMSGVMSAGSTVNVAPRNVGQVFASSPGASQANSS